jgi:glycosyltransferase involved in cell wall biosynthesis
LNNKKQKICFVATVDFSVKTFLIVHLRDLAKFYHLTVITNTNNINFLSDHAVDATVLPIKFSRKINLLSDLFCLIKLIYIFIINRYSAVHSITPKAGLLAMLAAFIARIPLRAHSFTGQVWVTSSGPKRVFLKSIDKLLAMLTTHNLVDSQSQRNFLIKENVLTKKKSLVFGKGSIAGVDLSKFKPNKRVRKSIRSDLALPEDSIVFIYLGRLVKDKGVLDLAYAFSEIEAREAYLLFVGPDEGVVAQRIKEICLNKIKNIRMIDFTPEPNKYLAASDVLCLPSYREGFGSVVIEAAAMGIPAIASNIYGITDALIDNKTGLLHEPKDIAGIRSKIEWVLTNPLYFKKLSISARERAVKEFDSKLITNEWVRFYNQNLT